MRSVPLLSPADVQTAAGVQGFQGVQGEASGSVHYPDDILAFPVASTAENKALLGAWHTSHAFFIVPVNIAIAPAPGMIPERLDISLAFQGLGQIGRQPLVIDTFPKTGFSAGPVSGRAEIKVGADLKFADIAPLAPTAGANASLAYAYAPAYANVVSGFGSGSAFWQFARTQDKYPAGDVPLKMIVAVPRGAKTQTVTMTVDVRVEYAGGWLKPRGISLISFRSRVNLPDTK